MKYGELLYGGTICAVCNVSGRCLRCLLEKDTGNYFDMERKAPPIRAVSPASFSTCSTITFASFWPQILVVELAFTPDFFVTVTVQVIFFYVLSLETSEFEKYTSGPVGESKYSMWHVRIR